MRDILFKAKRVDTGEWVEGYFTMNPNNGNAYITSNVCGGAHPDLVDQQTVCQYTGLTDKNGKKIFEGDRVLLDAGEEYEETGFVSYSTTGVFVVLFEKTWDFLYTNIEFAEIIGNIHD